MTSLTFKKSSDLKYIQVYSFKQDADGALFCVVVSFYCYLGDSTGVGKLKNTFFIKIQKNFK